MYAFIYIYDATPTRYFIALYNNTTVIYNKTKYQYLRVQYLGNLSTVYINLHNEGAAGNSIKI